MTPSQAFDPAEFKRNIRTEWRSAAAGWRKWLEVVEAEQGGQRHSAKLVELAGLQPGASVLDVGGGYGEPSLTAARVVGPHDGSSAPISRPRCSRSPASEPPSLDSPTSSSLLGTRRSSNSTKGFSMRFSAELRSCSCRTWQAP
jgi:hypothetical protein